MNLVFELGVLFVIVKEVIKCNIGVWGLCVIIEGIMFEIMYEVFLCEDVMNCVIIEEVVEKRVVFEFG